MALGAAAVLIAAVVGYNYHVDQVKARGAAFSADIVGIQDDLNALQVGFDADLAALRGGGIALDGFRERAGEHFAGMGGILERYDRLDPPGPFADSVAIFRLSAEAQLERDRETLLWLETGDESHDARADELHQAAFAHELAALAKFKEAQAGGG